MLRIKSFLCFTLVCFILTANYAQNKSDSTKHKRHSTKHKNDSTKQNSITRKALKEGMALITTHQNDTITNQASTDPFAGYENKIIRNINVEFIDFTRSIHDTTKHQNKIVKGVADALHTRTREIVIRNHLFVYKNTPLNPYRLADNERYLRDLDFILDARIIVTPVEGTDSVDLTTVTRDVFSLGGSLGGSAKAPKFSVYDANVAGLGQRVQFNGLMDVDRSPYFGNTISYTKSSWLGSLTDIQLAYTNLNAGIHLGAENEAAYLIRISRPLVSPYSRLAGGFEASNNVSINDYRKADSVFLNYRYKVFDTWLGYNIGIKRGFANRNRHFVALRYFHNYFDKVPVQENYRRSADYNSAHGVLADFTFYRKNFYKTRYVYGFGRTEDVPVGISSTVTIGYASELQIKRPYAGYSIDFTQANKRGNFYRLSFESGSYFKNQKVSDLIFKSAATFYTRALNVNRYKVRSYLSVGYSQLINRTTDNYLKISRDQIYAITADSVLGTQQIYSRWETTLFTPWHFIGFRFAPFISVDWTQANCYFCENSRPNIFGFNAGLRTRNESLIFGTMEIRFTYIPDNGEGDSQFKFNFRQNLRIKNSDTFVKPPRRVMN